MTSKPYPYIIGYRKPPKKHRFRKGQSGNPSGKRRNLSAPDLRAQLQSALNKGVTVGSGKSQKVITKGAAGIEQLVDQFAKGDRNARRDLILLCEKLKLDLTNREALEGALDDVLTTQDVAILDYYVRRHGGEYPVRTGNPEDANGSSAQPAFDVSLITLPPAIDMADAT